MHLEQDSLTTFCKEVLEWREGDHLVKDLLEELNTPSLPSLEKSLQGYDYISKLHGIKYDFEKQEVTVAYRVVGGLYEPVTLPFSIFYLLLRGLQLERLDLKWK